MTLPSRSSEQVSPDAWRKALAATPGVEGRRRASARSRSEHACVAAGACVTRTAARARRRPRGRSGDRHYGASKFAVEGFSEALANEVGPLGIAVTLVEPGVFRTDFPDGSSLQVAQHEIDAYAETAGRTRRGAAERNHTQQGDPARAAAAILRVAGRTGAPMRLPLGDDAVAAIEAKLARVAANVDATRELAASTAHR